MARGIAACESYKSTECEGDGGGILPKFSHASGVPAAAGTRGRARGSLLAKYFCSAAERRFGGGAVLRTNPQRARKKTKREGACWAAGAQRLIRVANPTVYFPLSFSSPSPSYSFLSIFLWRSSLTMEGGAFPLDSFITWPTRKAKAFSFPCLKSAIDWAFSLKT